jgi:hypothetical protein
MGRSKENLKMSEQFLRTVLRKNFKQTRINPKLLRKAAEELCDALPGKREPQPAEKTCG